MTTTILTSVTTAALAAYAAWLVCLNCAALRRWRIPRPRPAGARARHLARAACGSRPIRNTE